MRRAKHLTPTKYGTVAHIRIDGKLYQKHFPHDADPIDMRQWVVDQELAHRKGPSALGAFDADAVRYLTAVAAMTSYADRARDIFAWIAVFGQRPRAGITSTEIAAQLQTWRKTLSASTCNHRRTALQHMWTRLDGKGAQNPVKDVPRFHEPQPAPRALSYATIRKILKHIPKGPDKARLLLMAHTGLPNAIIAQLARASFNKRAMELAVPGRKKGAGSRARTLPLTPQGAAAMQMMIATKAWGPFSRYHLRRVFRLACEAAGVPIARPYDLRHSFGTEVYRKSGNLDAVQALLLHSSPTLTRRYALAAVDARVRAALKGVGR